MSGPPAGLATQFATRFGKAPSGIVFAPGRVNLIGDHVDYCDGVVLPMPLRVGTWIAWTPRDDATIQAVSLDFPGAPVALPLDGNIVPASGWSRYVAGMAACSRAAGLPVGGADLLIAGNLPRGAGLSSSASLCIAVGRALTAAAGAEAPDHRDRARAAQGAEREFAGVNCGIMDQMAIAAGLPGSALLLDCRTLACDTIPIPDDWAVAIVQSGVARELADGAYNERRADCENAARQLGIASLRDATVGKVQQGVLPPRLRRRACHVVSEIERTTRAAQAMRAADLNEFGRLMRESHASLRDDFEVSHPEVDRIVEALNTTLGGEGAARMTGGGFGGAVVAVTRRESLAALDDALVKLAKGRTRSLDVAFAT